MTCKSTLTASLKSLSQRVNSLIGKIESRTDKEFLSSLKALMKDSTRMFVHIQRIEPRKTNEMGENQQEVDANFELTKVVFKTNNVTAISGSPIEILLDPKITLDDVLHSSKEMPNHPTKREAKKRNTSRAGLVSSKD